MNAMTPAPFSPPAAALGAGITRTELRARSKALAERADDLEEQCRSLSYLTVTGDHAIDAEIERLTTLAEAVERQRDEVALALALADGDAAKPADLQPLTPLRAEQHTYL